VFNKQFVYIRSKLGAL